MKEVTSENINIEAAKNWFDLIEVRGSEDVRDQRKQENGLTLGL